MVKKFFFNSNKSSETCQSDHFQRTSIEETFLLIGECGHRQLHYDIILGFFSLWPGSPVAQRYLLLYKSKLSVTVWKPVSGLYSVDCSLVKAQGCCVLSCAIILSENSSPGHVISLLRCTFSLYRILTTDRLAWHGWPWPTHAPNSSFICHARFARVEFNQ